MIKLVTSANGRAFVGPELCRNREWLATATGYTLEYVMLVRGLTLANVYIVLHRLRTISMRIIVSSTQL